MKKNISRSLCLILALVLISGVLTCVGEGSVYPLEPITLTVNIDETPRDSIPDWALDYYIWDIIEEKTGVKLECWGADGRAGGNTEDINVLIASGSYPDIFINNWLSYPGGPSKALTNNVIMPLNDIIDEYCPNFKKVLDENESWAKDVATDDGTLYVFPLLRAARDKTFYGLGYRQDKLDELGLDIPTTPDELEEVLTAFKDAGMECGLTFEYRFLFTGDQGYGTILQSGFGLKSGWYVDNETVHFGEYEDAYYDFLVWLNRLYENGLIDPDMPSINKSTSLAKYSNGEAWAAVLQSSATVAGLEYVNADKGWKGVTGPSLATEPGAVPQFGHLQNTYAGNAAAAISTKCQNVEAAARFLDWFYGEENLETYQYGVEGFCYAVVDGEYTRDIQYLIPLEGENADNVEIRMNYGIIGTNWPMKMLDGFSHNYYAYPAETLEALAVWRQNNMEEHILPPVTLTVDEANEYASIYNDVDSYMKEHISLFITGKQSLDEYEEYRSVLEDLGIERLIEIEQAAYDRYLAR